MGGMRELDHAGRQHPRRTHRIWWRGKNGIVRCGRAIGDLVAHIQVEDVRGFEGFYCGGHINAWQYRGRRIAAERRRPHCPLGKLAVPPRLFVDSAAATSRVGRQKSGQRAHRGGGPRILESAGSFRANRCVGMRAGTWSGPMEVVTSIAGAFAYASGRDVRGQRPAARITPLGLTRTRLLPGGKVQLPGYRN